MSSVCNPLSLSSPWNLRRPAGLLSSRSNLRPLTVRCTVGEFVAEPKVASVVEPLLLNAVRGEKVERPPVWLMRQAGRYMKSYQIICEKYPSFRERSENVDLVVEISLQPWKVFKPDGDIKTQTMIGGGHERRGLYCLDVPLSSTSCSAVVDPIHCRLGHP